MKILINGKLNPDAVKGVTVDRLKADQRSALGAVLAKSSNGDNLTPDDVRTVLACRKSSGVSVTQKAPDLGDGIAALERALATAKAMRS